MAYDVIAHGSGNGRFTSETRPRDATAAEMRDATRGTSEYMADHHPNKTGMNWNTWYKISQIVLPAAGVMWGLLALQGGSNQ